MSVGAPSVEPFAGRLRGKRVLVTGDTGFKGSWLCWWLTGLGAEVHGLALEPHTSPNLFEQAGLAEVVRHRDADIRDASAVAAALAEVRPEVVFHLAAQAIVSESYRDPRRTLESNILGTLNVLEAIREAGRPCAVVVVTSDKCYEDQGWEFGYRETDRLGGSDPYSASKGAAELVAATYRRSYFAPDRLAEHGVAVATVRAGNVLGPGDFARDRIIPDCVRALVAGAPIPVRNPNAIRPWQHVLEPLSGYLTVAARLLGGLEEARATCEPWNFGPRPESCRPVRDVVEALVAAWGQGTWDVVGNAPDMKETRVLRLAIEKSVARLGWTPVWSFDETARRIADGYRVLTGGADVPGARAVLSESITAYVEAARGLGLGWAGAPSR